MLKIICIIVAIVLLLLVGFYYRMMRGPDLSRYEHLQEPEISTIPDTYVLEVGFNTSADGLKDVFGFLFKNYFKMKGVPKMVGKVPPPVARYENAVDFEMEANTRDALLKTMIWKGVAAIPLDSENVKLPDIKNDNLSARITHWQYGETAEILHVGAYDKEPSTVKSLRNYIESQGYEITGLHEEVYLRGPGTPFCKPKNYYTIIRYAVKKK